MQTSSVILGAKPLPLWSPIVILKSLYTPKTTTTTFSFNDSFSGGVSIAAAPPATATAPKWAQKTITLPPHKRGCHLITPKILKEIGQDLSGFKCGLAHLFLQHTSASLTINENYDSDVRDDTETFLNRVVPEGSAAPWKHTLEGPDDMPAHIKSSMFGCTLTCGWIPITNGQLNMGTWQLLNDRLIFRGRRICFFCSFLSSFCHRAYGCVSIEIILLHAELWLLLTEFEELMLKDDVELDACSLASLVTSQEANDLKRNGFFFFGKEKRLEREKLESTTIGNSGQVNRQEFFNLIRRDNK
ncbi:hypothetical protein RHGRI_015710 [Rhododendron griersonianum]|uniref:Uncharacterized protein n=1 Tax=Rhododendron griersonianum TaxID=479676 RepID=A0AAV6JNE4_9ERIC|nr:hypothetical protein RHGRI_015710 [Rhododendron griersonianum]KAG5542667.1 hypothetical protein RHGRI_015710 [Rhododendron griersonianum]